MFEKEPADAPSVRAEGKSVSEKAIAAVEGWYAQHFHRSALEGRAPISAADKAALVQAVTEATTKE